MLIVVVDMIDELNTNGTVLLAIRNTIYNYI